MTDVAYYRRRLAEELAAIGRANCAKAADAHREMAGLYRLLLDDDSATDNARVVHRKPKAETRAR